MSVVGAIQAFMRIPLGALGPAEWFHVFFVGGLVVTSFALVRRPFANLAVTTLYLATANTAVFGGVTTAIVAAVLIGNCVVGTIIVSDPRRLFRSPGVVLPAILGGLAIWAAFHGLARGNRIVLVVGDLYQILEFLFLFGLAHRLVTTERRFRTVAMVLIGAIVAASALQIVDATVGVQYLSEFRVQQGSGATAQRFINMNAPLAFGALLAVVPYARVKWPLLALSAFVLVMLILSFTRGLWLAAAVSMAAIIVLTPSKRVATVKVSAAAVIFAMGFLYVSGLDAVAIERTRFAVRQIRNSIGIDSPRAPQTAAASQDASQTPKSAANPTSSAIAGTPPPEPSAALPVLAQRRRLEHAAILPLIAEHPIAGSGLGATHRLPGEAILHGPKGQMVDNHYVHDLYLQIAFRLGVPGLVVFALMLGTYFRDAIRNLRKGRHSLENTGVMVGLIGAMVGEVVLSLTSPTILAHPTAGIIGLTMGITATTLSPVPGEGSDANPVRA